MSEIFGAAGQVASAAISAGAVKDATQMQIDALNQQKQFVFNELAPATVNEQATAASIQQAQNRLALQGQIDPALLAGRYQTEGQINQMTAGLGGGAVSDVSNSAAQTALAGNASVDQNKTALIDAAMKELSLGATLPPDVQNEIVQSGLERAGMTSGKASANGFGGQILRKELGSAGIQLQQQRQTHAATLMTQAQNLEQSRQQILTNLFPNLSNVQLNSLAGAQKVLAQSDSMVPTAGLSGSDIANIWLARVGATNQLGQQAANAAGAGGMAQAGIWNQALGGATVSGARAIPSTQSVWNSLVTSPSSSGGGTSFAGSSGVGAAEGGGDISP